MAELLPADSTMGAVTLRVADLDTLTAYYRDAVTLSVLTAEGERVVLGRGSVPAVILEHAPELRHAGPGEAGLFHTAILFDSEEALAAAVHSVARHAPGTFTGSADHLVSKAFYFTDPEGNGVELYWDRDRSQWSWTHGQVEMDRLFIDPNQFLQEHLTERGAALAEGATPFGEAAVGHIHLSIGDLASAREFYAERLGFEVTATFGNSALFVSAGGYHHHLGMNTWNSRGAGRRGLALGLGEVEIRVPGRDDLGALTERMQHYGVPTRDDGRTVSFEDPWANAVRVVA
ncbi:lyase [Leifsonia xyli subsp. cynodontis DSM 46306]|uniref:VOC domain-containing protein n=1 Tax=Leifsonia xyli subsp. cynodontis DSM 46306 TaxID=1389489 RepID=U3PCV7_LEIXC|nr:VOC family protein [Leifsonia xyli]AGW42607.1 lyase [Leifsonia xyli subsp. cynodontis DSM 46306]